MRNVRQREWIFDGSFAVPTSAGDGQPWVLTDTSSGGSPTMVNTANGLVTTLAATSEAENMCLSFGNILSYDIDDLIKFEADLSVSGIDAATTLVIGMASNRHDTPDSVAAHAWFRLEGSASLSALLAETDDGTNDNDDKATGLTLGSSVVQLGISFKEGVYTQAPPAAPLGGKANVLFSASNSSGLLRPVARNTLFNMSNYSGGLQPIMQLQKASGTGVPSVTLKRIKVVYRDNY